MMLLALVSWWYTTGWSSQVRRVGHRVDAVLETFSVSMLMGSLFDPFRQISAGATGGKGFEAQLRALGDRMFSRVFGAFVRSLFIAIGVTTALITGVLGLLQLMVWPFLPVLPLVGVALAVSGAGA